MYAEDLGSGWAHDVAQRGAAAIQLVCPGDGSIVGVLYRTGVGTIQYRVPGTDRSQRPWPPDPSATVYGEACECGRCQGRTVGASVEVLVERVIALSTDSTATQDTIALRYLPAARTLIKAEAARRGYLIHRDTSSRIDCYQRPQRTVIVGYNHADEVLDVHVEPDTTFYTATLHGALDALSRS